jgi:flagellar biosynthesis/type III secretory pathway chaperone
MTVSTNDKPLTSSEAEIAVGELETSMEQLLSVIEQETALVRSGHLRDAAALSERKSLVARDFTGRSARIKANKDMLARVLPAKMRALTERNKHLQQSLQANMTVLATAHAVGEDIIRGVSTEMVRTTQPSTYGASGRTNGPAPRAAHPLAVSRSI